MYVCMDSTQGVKNGLNHTKVMDYGKVCLMYLLSGVVHKIPKAIVMITVLDAQRIHRGSRKM